MSARQLSTPQESHLAATREPVTCPTVTVVRVTGNGRNVGKTTLAASLVEKLVARGWRVAAVKHSHHALPADRRGSDSDLLARAGAATTLFVGSDGVLERTPATRPRLRDLLGRLDGYQIAIVEGGRDDTVGARIHLDGAPPADVRVFDATGSESAPTSANDVDGLVARIEGWTEGSQSHPDLVLPALRAS